MTNYPPELIEDFEKTFGGAPKGCERLIDGRYAANYYHTGHRAAKHNARLEAFAHNWHRMRELEEVLREIIAYREGEGKYDFSCMADEVRGVAAFDAWDAIEQKARKLLEKGNE